MASMKITPRAPEPQATPKATADARKAATEMESFFLRRIFAEVRGSDGGWLGGGFAGGVFQDMLEESLADSMAKAGGIGLGKMLEKQLVATQPGAPQGQQAEAVAAAGQGVPADLIQDVAARLPPGLQGELQPAGLQAAASSSASRVRAAYAATVAMTGQLPPMPERPPHAVSEASAVLPGIVPVQGRVSSGFGHRIDPIDHEPRFHAGMDIAAPEGTPVVATAPGVVVRAERAGGYGNLVVIDHGGGLETRYGHLEHSIVRPGDRIQQGQEIGAVGETGRATGPHLHYEVRRDGRPVDPEQVAVEANEQRKQGIKISR